MENSFQISKVAEIVENAPLAEILDTVQIVASFVPVVGPVANVIIKILQILLKLQPAATNVMNGLADKQQCEAQANMFAKIESNIDKYSYFIPATETQDLNTLRTMVDIALEDGELTDEEQSFLLKKSDAAGIDHDLFLMGLKNELRKVQAC